jgi:hypothetical protein
MRASLIVRAALAATLATLALLPAAGAQVEPPAAPDGLAIGIVPQRGIGPGEPGRMRAAGIDSIRYYLSWRQVEGERGHYDWSGSDAFISAASAAGLEVLPFLYGSPDWAIAEDGDAVTCQPKCSPYAPQSADTRAAFARFAGAAVRRYGSDGSFWAAHPARPQRPIRAWQIWNEENSPFFYRPDADVASYAKLLAATAGEIRVADPAADVLLGGMWGPHNTEGGLIATARFLRDLYRIDGAAADFDGIAVHPYAGKVTGVMDQIRAVRRTAIRAGDRDVDLWITELGWASRGRPGEDLVKGVQGQAQMLDRVFSRLIARRARWNLRAAFWYAWRDTDPGSAVCRWCAQAGLISSAGTAKPALRALSSLASPPE